MGDRECAWCGESATTTAVYRSSPDYKRRLPACARCAARNKRKNLYLPCIIGARIEEMTDEEYVAALEANRWADRITEAEWKALLRQDGFSPSARSRLKAKASEWLIALGRIAYLDPELFAEIAAKAAETYEEQIEVSSFELQTLRNCADTEIAARERIKDGERLQTVSEVRIEEVEE
jgi:hypothetical protein